MAGGVNFHLQTRRGKEKSIKRALTSATPRQLKKPMRPVIELATTEPDFDGGTTDADDADDSRFGSSPNCTNLKIKRSNRRIDEKVKKMPPELTVTGAQQQHLQYQHQVRQITIETGDAEKLHTTFVTELPSIDRARRLNFSWQNFKKCVKYVKSSETENYIH